MDLEGLRRAHSRAYAIIRDVVFPLPLGDPWLEFDQPGSAILLGRDAVRSVIRVRNVGDVDCELLKNIRGSIAGISVVSLPAGTVLRARSPVMAALPLEVELWPFELPDSAVEATLSFDARSLRDHRAMSFQCSIRWRREHAAGPVEYVDRTELVFQDVMAGGGYPLTLAPPEASEVALSLEDGPDFDRPYPKRYPMSKRDDGVFAVVVSLAEGQHYAYRFIVDGKPRTDPRVPATEIVAGVEASSLEVPLRRRQTLRVRNGGTSELKVCPEANVDWLEVPSSPLRLQPRETAKGIEVRVRAQGLAVGRHIGEIVLKTNATDPLHREKKIPVRVTVTAPGPIPAVDDAVHDLGVIYFGAPVTKQVEIRNLGSGLLKGSVISEYRELEGKDFQVPEGTAPGRIDLTIDPGSTPPDQPKDYRPTVWLETNTPVFERKRLPLTVAYRIESMRLDPAEINFRVAVGLTERFLVHATVGNKQPIDAEIVPGSSFPEWIGVQLVRPGEIAVEIHGELWTGRTEQVARKELRLRDRKTGLVGTIALRGEFLVPKLDVDQRSLDFGKVARPASKSLSLKVRNTGQGALVLSQIVLDHEWL